MNPKGSKRNQKNQKDFKKNIKESQKFGKNPKDSKKIQKIPRESKRLKASYKDICLGPIIHKKLLSPENGEESQN